MSLPLEDDSKREKERVKWIKDGEEEKVETRNDRKIDRVSGREIKKSLDTQLAA